MKRNAARGFLRKPPTLAISKFQTVLPRSFCKGFDAPMIEKSASVKNDLLYPLLQCSPGYRSADDGSSIFVTPFSLQLRFYLF